MKENQKLYCLDFFKLCVLVVVATVMLSSCTKTDLFEKNVVIPGSAWKSDFAVKGSFTISDTTPSYNIYLVLRHTDAYQYNNIWINFSLQTPGDSAYTQKLNIQLGNDINGWEGTGMNDIWEIRKLLNIDTRYRRFPKPGNYHFIINQIMRDEPLRNMMSVGLRIEKEKI